MHSVPMPGDEGRPWGAALPIRVFLGQGENAASVLCRLAAATGMEDVRAFGRWIGVPLADVLYGRSLARLAVLADVPVRDLTRSTASVNAKRRQVRFGDGDEVALGDWTLRKRRWCPACFRYDVADAEERGRRTTNAPFHRFWWDVRAVEVCSRHGMPLVAACRSCGRPQGWRWSILHRCRCGADLSEYSPPSVPSGWSAYVTGRLGGAARIADAKLDCLPLSRVGRILERTFGIILGGGIPEGIPARECALEAISSASGPLYAGLDALGPAVVQKRGAIAAYGVSLMGWATNLPDVGIGGVLRSAIAAHAVSRGIVAEGEGFLGTPKARRCVGMLRASLRLERSSSTARRALSVRGRLPRGVRRGVLQPIPSEAVAAVRRERRRWVGIGSLRILLGVGKKQAVRIGRAFLKEQPKAPQDAGRRYSIAEARHLLARVHYGATLVHKTSEGFMPLPKACRAQHVPLEKAVGLILGRRLSVPGVLKDRSGLAAVVVDPTELRKAVNSPPGENLDLTQAAAILGMHPEAAAHLARRGLLPASRKAARWSISAAAVREFRAMYVAGSEAASSLGMSPRKCAAALRGLGSVPLCGPPSVRQYVYLRTDVQALSARRQTVSGSRARPQMGLAATPGSVPRRIRKKAAYR